MSEATPDRLNVYYDFEFFERGPDHPVQVISLGMCDDTGRRYYAQSLGFHLTDASRNKWLRDHVLKNLLLCPAHNSTHERQTILRYTRPLLRSKPRWFVELSADFTYHYGYTDTGRCESDGCPWRKRAQMADEVSAWIETLRRVRLVGYYADYDHVCLAQLFGAMVDLPKHIPMWTYDIQQLCEELGDPQLPAQSEQGEHNALVDALWTQYRYHWLRQLPAAAEMASARARLAQTHQAVIASEDEETFSLLDAVDEP